MNHLLVLAQTGSGSSTQAMLAAIFPFILMFVVLYFLMIRPQKRKENERKKMIEAVKKGDRVVTLGGIFGKVVSAKDDELIIQIDPAKDVCVKFTRSAVSRVIEPDKRAE
jgi:preprotein translocase subunit YajC